MTEFYVSMKSILDVRTFVSKATACHVDIDVVSGRYTVNAKSILGLFSLVLVEPEMDAPVADSPVLVRVFGSDADGQAFRESVSAMEVPAPKDSRL